MIKQITYRDKFTSASTVYADINKAEKLYMLDQISRAYYELIERTNYNDIALLSFHQQHKLFRKHIASGNRRLNNSLGSFLAGLLRQHLNKPDKDISTKMLDGISLATEILSELGIECPHYTFVKQDSKRMDQDAFGRLFQ